MGLKEGLFKTSGYYGRYEATTKISSGIILIILAIGFAIYSFVVGKELLVIGLFISLFALLSGIWLIIQGWLLWKRSASLVKGKFM